MNTLFWISISWPLVQASIQISPQVSHQASNQGGPPVLALVLFPFFWMAVSALVNLFMGIYALYRRFPADGLDPIEETLRWKTVEFGRLHGHAPMNLGFGKRALHLKEPFPFQPFFWLGPASIPWSEITQTRLQNEAWWRFWSAASFQLGASGRVIHVRGRVAKAIQARLEDTTVNQPRSITPR